MAEAVLLAVGAPVALGWAASRPARVLAVRAKGGDMTRLTASEQIAELTEERDAALAEVARMRERRAVICETCHGTGLVHAYSATDTCSDCGNDGCGPGVRWEK